MSVLDTTMYKVGLGQVKITANSKVVHAMRPIPHLLHLSFPLSLRLSLKIRIDSEN